MPSLREIRTFALALPDVVEQDHHGFPSFRVAKKIFATLPNESTVNVMLPQDEAEVAVESAPHACELLWWGTKLAGVRVKIEAADPGFVEGLLREAWRRKAPRGMAATRP